MRTGRIRWTFHTIPHPGEPGYETWPPDAWTRVGGANSWSGLSVDAARGLVFVPTGSAAFDFWGGNRHGANLYANSLIALDAATGEHVWHFQFVHHDIWDRDLPQAPVLVTVRRDGRDVDAVAQATKSGYVFVFDRETGAPLFPIEERPAPRVRRRRASRRGRRSRVPVKPPPFARQTLTEADVTTISPEAAASARERLRGGPHRPPVHAAERAGHDHLSGLRRRRRVGRLGVRPALGPSVRQRQRDGVDPAPGQPADAAWRARRAGRRTYQVYCGTCHGEDRGGDPQRTYPSLNDIESRLSRANVHDIIRKGRGVMPPFAMLTDAERDALVAYLFNDVRPPRAAAERRRPAVGHPLHAHRLQPLPRSARATRRFVRRGAR